MCKFFFLAITFLLSLGLPFKIIAADDKFSVASSFHYLVNDTGLTTVSQSTKLTNKTSQFFASEYTSVISNAAAKNIHASDRAGALKVYASNIADGQQEIRVLFSRPAVGINSSFSWTMTYDTVEMAKKAGRVWEVNLPKQDGLGADVKLTTPASFGPLIYAKPAANKVSGRDYFWKGSELAGKGISLAFGEAQLFGFSLKYQIENINIFNDTIEITLLPWTSSQKVTYQTLEPRPDKVYVDSEGNWVAAYNLMPRQVVEVTAKGSVLVFVPDSKPQEVGDKYLSAVKYWEADDSALKAKALELGSVEKIYQYIVATLKYDTKRVTNNQPRIGAAAVFADPFSAICVEFTDLFIAMSRAIGVPAREVNGYAYSSDEVKRPILTTRDSLHAWPEYYDSAKKQWVAVDPTWENTTGGVDYFTAMDLNHILFVNRGISSTSPLAAGLYKLSGDEKNVEVWIDETSQVPAFTAKTSELKIEVPKAIYVNPFRESGFNLQFVNPTGKFYEGEGDIPTVLPYSTATLERKYTPRWLFLPASDIIMITSGTDVIRRPVTILPIWFKPEIAGGFLLALVTLVLGVLIAKASRNLHLPFKK